MDLVKTLCTCAKLFGVFNQNKGTPLVPNSLFAIKGSLGKRAECRVRVRLTPASRNLEAPIIL